MAELTNARQWYRPRPFDTIIDSAAWQVSLSENFCYCSRWHCFSGKNRDKNIFMCCPLASIEFPFFRIFVTDAYYFYAGSVWPRITCYLLVRAWALASFGNAKLTIFGGMRGCFNHLAMLCYVAHSRGRAAMCNTLQQNETSHQKVQSRNSFAFCAIQLTLPVIFLRGLAAKHFPSLATGENSFTYLEISTSWHAAN